MNKSKIWITAPLSQIEQIPIFSSAGANEVYCGVLPGDWSGKYGQHDSLSRRQGTHANFASVDELLRIPGIAAKNNLQSSLALNCGYTQSQFPQVMEIAESWQSAGGSAVIASDMAVIAKLATLRSPPRIHVSVLTVIANIGAIKLLREYGVEVITFPGHLSALEMLVLASEFSDTEFGMIVLNDHCSFVDGLCSFYHGVMLDDGVVPDNHTDLGDGLLFASDLAYAGHGCCLDFYSVTGWINFSASSALEQCKLCDIPVLYPHISRYKIAGRGFPTVMLADQIRLLRRIGDSFEQDAATTVNKDRFRDLRKQVYGQPCPEKCPRLIR